MSAPTEFENIRAFLEISVTIISSAPALLVTATHKVPIGPDPVIKIDNENFKLWGCYSYILPSKQAIKDVYNVISSVFLQGPGKDIHRDWRTGQIRLRATNIDTMYINFFQRFGKCHVLNPVKTMPRVFDTNIVDNRKRYGLSTFLNSKDREMLEEL